MKNFVTNKTVRDGLTLLVVDDSELIRKLLAKLLTQMGFFVLTASHGLEALARVCEDKPDAVLLDITMPSVDGYEVCQLIKSSREYANLPVILVSSHDGLFDQAKGRCVGCDAYVSKPFTKHELRSVLKKFFVEEPSGSVVSSLKANS